MKTSTLLTFCVVAAFGCAAMTVGCSNPDVTPFNGTAADTGDDDDSTAPKKKPTASTSGDDDDDDDDSTAATTKVPVASTSQASTTTTTTSSSSSSGAAATTGAACFTHCVSTEPSAAALDACSNKCADGDANCLSACFDTSGCGADSLCNEALDQCDGKCFPATG